MKKDVFISYKSEEYEIADWVRSVLETNGIACWMAPRDIPGGSNYAAEIPAAISSCRVFVVVLSEKTQNSPWVPKELDLAVNHGTLIMPFMLENFKLRDDFNFYLSNVQRYAAYEDKSKAIERMVKEIQAFLGAAPSSASLPEPVKNPGKSAKGKIIALCAALVLIVCVVLAVILFGKRPGAVPSPSDEAEMVKTEDAAIGSELFEGAQPAVVVSADTEHENEPSEVAEPSVVVSTGEEEEQTGGAEPDVTASQEPDIGEEPDGETVPAETVRKEDSRYHITVYPSDDMSVKHYSAAVRTLRDRLGIFTGGQEYEWIDDEDGRVNLFLPREAFAGIQIEQILRCYLTRATKLYFMDQGNIRVFLPMERSDLESVTLQTGAIPDLDVTEYGISDAEYQYVEVRLADDFVEKHRAEYEEWEEPAFAQDREESGSIFYSFKTFPAGDGKTYYILNTDPDPKFTELTVYNLTHESLSESFYFIVDVNTRTVWEDPDTVTAKGVNQCAADAFTEGTVSFTIKLGEISAGKLMDSETALKRRLDTLEMPYAVGVSGEGTDNVLITVKTRLERMGKPVIDMLCGKTTSYLRSNQLSCYVYRLQISEVRKQEYAYELTYGYSSRPEEYTLLAEKAKEAGEEAIFLCMNSHPSLAFRVDEVLASGQLITTDLCRVRDGHPELVPIDPENAWRVNLLKEMVNTESLMSYASLNSYQMNPAEDGTVPTTADFGITDDTDISGITETITGIHAGATVGYGDGILSVYLHLPVDGELPRKMLSIAQQIYEKTDMLNTCMRTLCIYAADREETAGGTASIVFDKRYGEQATDEENKRYYKETLCALTGMFGNGAIDPYVDEIQELIAGSEFWQSFKEENTQWYFR